MLVYFVACLEFFQSLWGLGEGGGLRTWLRG